MRRFTSSASRYPRKAGSAVYVGGVNTWSNPSTWGGTIPPDGDNTTIAPGVTVILDCATKSLGNITINGTLIADNLRDIALTASSINIGASGTLQIGSESVPYAKKAVITLTGAESGRATRYVPDITGQTGVGNGTLKQLDSGTGAVAAGTFTVTFTSATAFGVVGPGAENLGTGTVGALFNNKIRFIAAAGGTAFSNADTITVTTVALGFTNANTRGITVQPGGKLILQGRPPAVTRTTIDAHITGGATSATLAESVMWGKLDSIAIGTTDFYASSSADRLFTPAAYGTTLPVRGAIPTGKWGLMQYVTDSGMATSPGALTSPPAGAATTIDQRAWVINLTRNIVIQGAEDSAWVNSRFGAHVMMMGLSSVAQVNGVEFRRVGQAGAIGRYPFHWHMLSYNQPYGPSLPSDGTFLGAANPANHYLKNCAIHQSGQRMVVIHGTHGVLVDSNVGYDITGHGIFLEEGSEQDNVITNNVVMKVRAPTAGNKILNHDSASGGLGSENIGVHGTNGTAGIWFTNPQNTLTGNWVNDSEGCGIWHAFATKCFGFTSDVAISPFMLSPTAISNNIAYGNKGVGIQTNRPQTDNKGSTSDSTTYQGSFFANPITGLKTFKNGAGGYSNRVLDAQYTNFVSADNAGMDVFGQAQMSRSIAKRWLTVAESLNNATSRMVSSKRSAFATYHELLNFQDGIAVGYGYITGSQFNDRATATGGGLFRMEDLYTQPMFTFALNTGIKQINNAPPFRARPPNIDGYAIPIPSMPGQFRNWTLSGAIKDVNGLFGSAGKYWVFNDPFFTYGLSASTNVAAGGDSAGSNGLYTDDRFFGIGPSWHTADSFEDSTNHLPITIVQQDSGGTTVGTWSVGDGTTSAFLGNMRHVSVRNGGRYKVSFPGNIATSVAEFGVSLMDNTNDIFLLGVEWSNSVPAKVIQRAQQFNGRTGFVPNVPSGADISAGIARQLTSTGSFANVLVDTTGTIFWQDTTNNTVWFKVKTASLANAFGSYSGSDLIYKSVKFAVTS